MDEKLRNVIFSVTGLLATLFIAWYFSHRNDADVTAQQPQEPQLNFGGSGITVPPLDVPPVNVAPNAAQQNNCCKRCVSPFDTNAGKILSAGNFTQETYNATKAITKNPTITTSNVTAAPATPTGPMLLAQANGGLPLPSENWWKSDAIYRQAYVLAYNQVVGQQAFTIQNQHRPAIPNMSMTVSESASPNAAINAAQSAGQQQLARGGNDSRWLMEAQSNSMLFMQLMQTALNNWMKQLGDKNVAGGNFVAPPDQNISSFLIN